MYFPAWICVLASYNRKDRQPESDQSSGIVDDRLTRRRAIADVSGGSADSTVNLQNSRQIGKSYRLKFQTNLSAGSEIQAGFGREKRYRRLPFPFKVVCRDWGWPTGWFPVSGLETVLHSPMTSEGWIQPVIYTRYLSTSLTRVEGPSEKFRIKIESKREKSPKQANLITIKPQLFANQIGGAGGTPTLNWPIQKTANLRAATISFRNPLMSQLSPSWCTDTKIRGSCSDN